MKYLYRNLYGSIDVNKIHSQKTYFKGDGIAERDAGIIKAHNIEAVFMIEMLHLNSQRRVSDRL